MIFVTSGSTPPPTAKNRKNPSTNPMIGKASRMPTPRKKNTKMLPRASGWRAIDSTAFDATIPSPTAEPRATAATMIAKPVIRTAATMTSGVTIDLSGLVVLGRGQGQIDDGQQGEHERLDRSDEEVEEFNPDRCYRGQQRNVQRSDDDVRLDDGGDDVQKQLAGEDVEREAHREDDRAGELFGKIDDDERPERLEEVDVGLDPALADREELDREEDAQREGRRGVEIGGR